MNATYTWEIKNIIAKPVFTDKHGTLRNNVIKSVLLEYRGEFEGKTEATQKQVDFSLGDLTTFTPVEDLDSSNLLEWSLNKIHPKEKAGLEFSVQRHFEDLAQPNTTTIELNT